MIQLHQYAKWIDRDHFRLEFALPSEGPLPDSLRDIGETVHPIDLKRRFDIPGIRRLAGLCSELGVQIVHSHNARANVHARIACRMAHVPVQISTIHNSIFNYGVSAVRQYLYVTAERFTARWCAQIIAVSEGISGDLMNRYGFHPEKITVVPNGVDLDRIEPQLDRSSARSGLDVPADSTVILQVGRLTPQKGFDILLDAFSELQRDHPGLVLLLVGEGSSRYDLEEQARLLGIERQTRFLGHRDDIADLLCSADIVTLSSRSEGMPYTLLEAMAAGCPVIATRIPGIEEVVRSEDLAVLVPPEDPEALASAISGLLSDSARVKSLGEAARRYIHEHHTARGMVEKVQRIYQLHYGRKVQ